MTAIWSVATVFEFGPGPRVVGNVVDGGIQHQDYSAYYLHLYIVIDVVRNEIRPRHKVIFHASTAFLMMTVLVLIWHEVVACSHMT